MDILTKFNLTYKYTLITLIYCDFGVLPTQTRREPLEKVYKALFPSGLLIFDVFTSQKYDAIQENNSWDICENGL